MSADAGALDLTLGEASAHLARRALSAVELVDACLERIAQLDERLHAYITVLGADARREAKHADALLAAGEVNGPLHGIPIALKDNIAVAGRPTTAGSRLLATWRPRRDAEVTRRLRAAGAVVIGKTNMDELALGGISANPSYGTVGNPWDPRLFAAGSSGGSAAAVAARTCFGALGTDTAGSVRLPAAATGVTGLRPTFGAVPNQGVVPLAWSMDTVGPLTKTVRDCATLFEVLSDGGSAAERKLTDAYVDDACAGLRVGTIAGYCFDGVQDAVEDAVRRALETLERLGATSAELSVEHVELNASALLTTQYCEAGAYHRDRLRDEADSYGEDVRLRLEVGAVYPAVDYVQAQRYRALLRERVLAALDRVDVLICPAMGFTAIPIGDDRVTLKDGRQERLLDALIRFTGVASLTGLPALVLPCGFDRSRLPIGLQVVGRPFDELRLLAVGAAFERATWGDAPPLPP